MVGRDVPGGVVSTIRRNVPVSRLRPYPRPRPGTPLREDRTSVEVTRGRHVRITEPGSGVGPFPADGPGAGPP